MLLAHDVRVEPLRKPGMGKSDLAIPDYDSFIAAIRAEPGSQLPRLRGSGMDAGWEERSDCTWLRLPRILVKEA